MSRLSSLLPGTIAGRVIVVLLIGLTASHVASVGLYRSDLREELGISTSRLLAERIVAMQRAIAASPPEDRDRTAHALSGPGVEVHWDNAPSTEAPAPDAWKTQLARHIAEIQTDLQANRPSSIPTDEHAGSDAGGAASGIQIATKLPDGTWANFELHSIGDSMLRSQQEHLLMSTTLMVVAILGLAVVSVRILTRPLRSLERAARRLGVDMNAPPLPETGPREVRSAAHAFNDMQNRIRRLVRDRTQMFAAISHDLKTPITRVRLRAEFVDDADQRAKLLADLDEMEAMVFSALAFLREDADTEEAKVVNLSAIFDTICNAAADAGHRAEYVGESYLPFRGRPLALKRSLTNVIQNAILYGGGALVRARSSDHEIRIEIDDEGPGIPPAEQDRVFEPFYRIEGSRSRETGGSGLGLAVARSVIRAHGGDIELSNREVRGLRVTITLPRLGLPQPQ